MSTLLELLQTPWTHRLGWTLVHFLWQGTLLAALFAVARALLRSASASFRYLAGCATLSLMVVVMALTFYGQKTPQKTITPAAAIAGTAEAATPNESTPVSVTLLKVTPARRTEGQIGVMEQLRQFPGSLEQMFPWLVGAWMLGVGILSLRLGTGWLKVRSLKAGSNLPVGEDWLEKLNELRARLGICRSVHLVQSRAVAVPAVIGWFKPVILFPLSTLAGLSPGQVEAILAHELAHVRRHDYLVNLLQSAVETLLFYHPAVWWVSRCVRQERENCCDDLAVQVCGDALQYARALATLEELRPQPVGLALAADGKPLLQRIRRLLHQNDPHNSRATTNGGLLSIVLLLALFIGLPLAHSQKSQSPDVTKKPQGETTNASNSSLEPEGIGARSAEPDPKPELYMRTFKVDPNVFLRRVQSEWKMFTNGQTHQFGDSGRYGSKTVVAGDPDPIQVLQEPLKALGLDLKAPGRQLFYSSGKGMLMVRATLRELDKVEQFVNVFNKAPPQVELECKIVVIAEEAGKQFLLEEILGKARLYSSTNRVELYYPNRTHRDSGERTRSSGSGDASVSILSAAQHRSILDELGKYPGVEVLTMPKVVTISSRQTQLKLVGVRYHVTNKNSGTNSPQRKETHGSRGANAEAENESGPALDIVPYVSADGFTIQLSVISTVSEFVGYYLGGGDPFEELRNTVPTPVYRKRQVTAPAVVWDGQTLVLDTGTVVLLPPVTDGDHPIWGDLLKPEDKLMASKRKVLFFITPTIIDPAGNRTNIEEEMPFSKTYVPPQKGDR